MRTSVWRGSGFVGALLSIAVVFTIGRATAGPAAQSGHQYTYATAGVMDHVHVAGIDWKILLNQSNLGGPELEMVETTFPAGMLVPSHTHKSVEIIYVLAGTYEHEVNGELFRLTRGMIGIVRPGDHVRHIVPKSGPARVLIIWAPAGELGRDFRHLRGATIPAVKPAEAVSAP